MWGGGHRINLTSKVKKKGSSLAVALKKEFGTRLTKFDHCGGRRREHLSDRSIEIRLTATGSLTYLAGYEHLFLFFPPSYNRRLSIFITVE